LHESRTDRGGAAPLVLRLQVAVAAVPVVAVIALEL